MNQAVSSILLVMLGGAFGAAIRYLLTDWLLQRFRDDMPWGTLLANLMGSFAIGYLYVWLQGKGDYAHYLRMLLVVGLLGGLTTFSSLMLELFVFSQQHNYKGVLFYLLVSLLGGGFLLWLGVRLASLQ